LLTGGSRTALPRQQTLRALIDWSYDMLPENERILLRRLSVFSGGCTLEAAEQVCSDDSIQVEDVLDLLTHLVDKSLLAVEEESDHLRYRILETVRQYAREKLFESGEGEKLRKRHLVYFLKLAQEAELNLKGAGYIKVMNQLAEEYANILAALDWALEVGHMEGQQLVGALWWFWSDSGYSNEGLEWSKRALAVNDGTPTPVRIRLLTVAGWFAYMNGFSVSGLFDQAIVWCNESIAIARELGRPEEAAWPLATLGLICTFSDRDLAQAERLLQESLALFRKNQDSNGIRSVLTYLGWFFQFQGNYEQAEKLLQESLNVSRESGQIEGMSWALQLLGELASEQGNYVRALSYYEESKSLLQGAKTIMGVWILDKEATAYLQMGDYEQAKKTFEEVLSLYRERGNQGDILGVLLRLNSVARLEGDYPKACEYLLEGSHLIKKLGNDKDDIAIFLIDCGLLMLAQNSPGKYAQLLGMANSISPALLTTTTIVSSFFINWTEQAMESARAALGDEAYNVAYEAGKQMSLDESVAYTLKELGQ
jgi:non-specific serine/threonine protein kinase